MFLLFLAALLVWLLIRWDEHAFHQPHNVRFALRSALLRWFLLVVLLWLTVSVLQRRDFTRILPPLPPPPRSDKQTGGTVAVCDGFRSKRVFDHQSADRSGQFIAHVETLATA